MKGVKKPDGYWTLENCAEVARRCKTKKEFREKFQGAYSAAFKKGWLDKVSSHMQATRRPNGYWTLEKCKGAALKCKHKTEFQRRYRGAYSVSSINGWLGEVCAHMKILLNTYTIEECFDKSKLCKYRSEFSKKFPKEYDFARRKKWLDEICSHMKPAGNVMHRMVYAQEFQVTNCVYVGLTGRIEKRKTQHVTEKRETIYKYILKTGLKPTLKEISGYLPVEKAIVLEDKTIKKYRKAGWTVLNIAKAGALGGNTQKWTEEKCRTVALQCKARNEFLRKSPSAYSAAWQNEWLSDICKHMNRLVNPPNFWTKERCHKKALMCKTKKQFRTRFPTVYTCAWKNGWLNDITIHMDEIRKPRNYWTFELCAIEAKKYKTRNAFKEKSSAALDSATRKGWLDKICSHMKTEWRLRPVIQLSKTGKEIKRFDSIRQAAYKTGGNPTSISSCCIGKEKTARGSKWKYAD